MSTISTHLRNFKEPTREQLNLLFFSLPVDAETHGGEKAVSGELEKMEINAVLSLGVQGEEDSYVSAFILSEHPLRASLLRACFLLVECNGGACS